MLAPKLIKEEFLAKYSNAAEGFAKAAIDWSELSAIHENYYTHRAALNTVCTTLAETLRRCSSVHSLKVRVKDAEHLIEKIIRKRCECPERTINRENYLQELTDCAGVRALHLFKDEWELIHDFILKEFNVIPSVVANIRVGDAGALVEAYKARNCVLKEHPMGYRSVHYTISVRPGKIDLLAELQVRTIFEEGWSEIDHSIRYPYKQSDTVLGEYLGIFNRLAGSADEMGTFIKRLASLLETQRQEHATSLQKKDAVIRELTGQIEKLKIAQSDKTALQEKLKEIQSFQTDISQNVLKDINISSDLLEKILAPRATDKLWASLIAPTALEKVVKSLNPMATPNLSNLLDPYKKISDGKKI